MGKQQQPMSPSSSSSSSSIQHHRIGYRRSHCGKNAVVVYPVPQGSGLVYEFFWQKNRRHKSYYKCCVCDRQARSYKKKFPHVAQLNSELRRVKVVHVVGESIVGGDPTIGHHPNCRPLTAVESINNANRCIQSSSSSADGVAKKKHRRSTAGQQVPVSFVVAASNGEETQQACLMLNVAAAAVAAANATENDFGDIVVG